MALYRDHILPHLVRLTMRSHNLTPYRERVLATATGRVLEIGIGAGANLSFYGSDVREVIGLEPSPRLGAMTRRAAECAGSPVTVIEGSAEKIPLDARSVDAVVM